jgi:phytol kinase
MIEWLPIVTILLALAAGLWSVHWIAAKRAWPVEWSRKVIHVTMGSVCAIFPWIFQEPISVWITALGSVLMVFAVRVVPVLRRGMGDGLLSISRVSFGDLLFAPAVAAVFYWSDDRWAHYLIPVLLLTLADAAGALVGVRYGIHQYQARTGKKTIEGSSAFFVAAFAVVASVDFFFNGQTLVSSLLVAFILACLTMMVEAVADRGFDNLTIPVAGYFLYDQLHQKADDFLAWQIVVLVLLLVLLGICHRKTTLTGGALQAAILLAYGCYALGDWRMMLPLLLVFAVHLWTTHRYQIASSLQHGLSIIAALSVPTLLCLIAYQRDRIDLASCHAAMVAIAGTHICLMTRATVYRLKLSQFIGWAFVKGLCCVLILIASMSLTIPYQTLGIFCGLLLGCLFMHEFSLRRFNADGKWILYERSLWCVLISFIMAIL